MRDLSRDLERLLHLAQLGDAAAADRLWTEAQRRGDRALCAEAAVASGDPARAAEVASTYWAAADWASFTAFCQRMGLNINADWAAQVQSMLKEAHSARRARLLSPVHVLQCAFAARWAPPSAPNLPVLTPAIDPADPTCGAFTLTLARRDGEVAMASIHGGVKKLSMGSPQTTFCLAVFDPSCARLTLSVKTVSAASPSPSTGWPDEVRPWKRNLLDNLPKLATWAARAALDRVQASICDAAPAAQATYAAASAAPAQANLLDELDALLRAAPSPQSFKAVVALFDDWPAADLARLRADALPHALAALAARWPDDARVLTRKQFTRLKRHPSKRRPSDDLYRHLDLADATADDALALSAWPLSGQLTHLSLGLRDSAPLAPLVEARAALTTLHTLTLTSAAHYPYAVIDVGALLSSPPWPALKSLRLGLVSAQLGAPSALSLLDGVEVFDVEHLSPYRSYRRAPAEESQRAAASRASLAPLSRAPLSALRSLSMFDHFALEAIARNPALPQLRRLHIRGDASELVTTLGALCVHPTLRLHALRCDGFSPLLGHLRALLTGAVGADLRDLSLTLSCRGDALCDLLKALPQLTALTLSAPRGSSRLGLREEQNIMTDAGLLALAARPPSLEDLILPGHCITSAGVTALASSPAVARLKALDLTNNRLDAAACAALGASPHLGALRTLNLSFNAIGSDGLRALAMSPHLNSLEVLSLERCEVGVEGVQALVASPHLPALRELTLSQNPLTNRAAELLAAHPAMARLQRIHLYQAGIGKKGTATLAATPWLRGRFDGLPGYSAPR
jgi:hypothetical protein